MDATLRQLIETLAATEHNLLVLNEQNQHLLAHVQELDASNQRLREHNLELIAQAESIKATLKERQAETRDELLAARAARAAAKANANGKGGAQLVPEPEA